MSNWKFVLPSGTVRDIAVDYGMRVQLATGHGMPPMKLHAQPYGIIDGSYYAGAIVRERVVQLKMYVISGGTPQGLMQQRQLMIADITRDALNGNTFKLRYQGDARNLDLLVRYDGGLEGEMPEDFLEFPVVRLLAVDPFWRDADAASVNSSGTGTVAAGYQAELAGEAALIGYWKLDETSGTTATDTEAGRNGTYTGSVALNQASLIGTGAGKAARFDADTEFVEVAHASALTPSELTIVAAINVHTLPDATSLAINILAKDGLSFYVNRHNQLVLSHNGPALGASLAAYSGKIHVAATIDATAGLAKLYVNGALVASQSSPGAPLYGTDPLYIAQRAAGAGDMTADEVAFFNAPLTAARIAALYTAFAAASVTNTISQTFTVYGDADVPPKLVLTMSSGTGTLTSIENVTTGKVMTFSSYAVATGEVITIDLQQPTKRCISSVSGVIPFAPGSSIATFLLIPGSNTIRVTLAGSGSMNVAIEHAPRYWSMDGAG